MEALPAHVWHTCGTRNRLNRNTVELTSEAMRSISSSKSAISSASCGGFHGTPVSRPPPSLLSPLPPPLNRHQHNTTPYQHVTLPTDTNAHPSRHLCALQRHQRTPRPATHRQCAAQRTTQRTTQRTNTSMRNTAAEESVADPGAGGGGLLLVQQHLGLDLLGLREAAQRVRVVPEATNQPRLSVSPAWEEHGKKRFQWSE